jgi:hypothetical protein
MDVTMPRNCTAINAPMFDCQLVAVVEISDQELEAIRQRIESLL